MMEDMSLKLWRILNNVVGNREEVYIRQRYYAIADKIFTRMEYNIRQISSGSKAEGLYLSGSDEDIMYVNPTIQVTQSQFEDEPNRGLIMDTTNIKPGFTKLRLVTRQNRGMDKLGPFVTALTQVNDCLYLSSFLYRDRQIEIFRRYIQADVQPHGPCGTFKQEGNFEYDFMLCLHCANWPNVANEWIHRHRTLNWPHQDLVVDVVSDGCLFVPVGNPLSDESHMEWRISFSVAEKKLVHSMNHTQILCYGLLKFFLKHVIDSRDDCKGLLCSYFLKTALFYCIEEENIEWEKHNLFPCFMVCLRRLLFWVREGYCPNYFVRTNNMFESKIVGEKQRQLEEYLFILYENGFDSVMRIPIIFSMHQKGLCQFPSEDYSANEFQCDHEVFLASCFQHEANIKDVRMIMDRIQRELLKANIDQVDGMLLMIQDFVHRALFVPYQYQLITTSDISNKVRYTQLRSLSKYILDECTRGDVCTGRILYATLCYLTGKNNKVISTVDYMLTKFKPFVYYRGLINSTVDETEYINHMCGKNFTVEQKLSSAFALVYTAIVGCKFYPEEIRPEIEQHQLKVFPVTCIPPTVYCYVLLFLVYNKTGRYEMRNKIIDKLCIEVEKGKFITEHERPLALALLQKCLDLVNS